MYNKSFFGTYNFDYYSHKLIHLFPIIPTNIDCCLHEMVMFIMSFEILKQDLMVQIGSPFLAGQIISISARYVVFLILL